jgi:RNA polymerase sigma-70 factor (ECF subfamily)
MADPFTDDLVALLPRLRRFALSLARRPDLADDLVQTTAERAIAARGSFHPGTRLDAWLFRIMHNSWIDVVRRDRTRGQEIDIVDVPESLSIDGRTVTEASLMLQSASLAMKKLPDDQREVMMLICVEELSYREAADVLGIPIGTVMSRLARARLAISGALGIK